MTESNEGKRRRRRRAAVTRIKVPGEEERGGRKTEVDGMDGGGVIPCPSTAAEAEAVTSVILAP